jgi:glycosyltransferase involved in cell wall biosynthesis
MRLIYIKIYEGLSPGVDIKVSSQVKGLRDLGVDAGIALIMDDGSCHYQNELMKPRKISITRSHSKLSIYSRIRRQYIINRSLFAISRSAGEDDIIYIRYPYTIPFCPWLFKASSRRHRLITEYNTIETKEMLLLKSYFSLFWDLLFGSIARRQSDGLVSVTNEIMAYQLKRCGNSTKAHAIIGNGVDVSSIRLRTPPDFSEQELKLLVIANVNSWHGIDRLLNGMAIYKGSTKLHLYIVGNGPELSNLRSLVRNLHLEANVFFTGVLIGSELDCLFDKCHIAVGSLAIHRKGFNQTSALKIREYSACGIPFLSNPFDSDFPDGFLYCLKVPATESPVNVEDIISFAKIVYLDPKHNQKMRDYAKEKLDWSVKMKILKDFCESLAAENV